MLEIVGKGIDKTPSRLYNMGEMKKEIKYSRSRVERSCGICGVRGPDKAPVNTIKVGDLYRMIRHYGRYAEEWPICKKCDEV